MSGTMEKNIKNQETKQEILSMTGDMTKTETEIGR